MTPTDQKWLENDREQMIALAKERNVNFIRSYDELVKLIDEDMNNKGFINKINDLFSFVLRKVGKLLLFDSVYLKSYLAASNCVWQALHVKKLCYVYEEKRINCAVVGRYSMRRRVYCIRCEGADSLREERVRVRHLLGYREKALDVSQCIIFMLANFVFLQDVCLCNYESGDKIVISDVVFLWSKAIIALEIVN